jgi:hypothetical protein
VFDKHVPLFERAFVEQDLEALASRELAFGVLRVNALLPTAHSSSSALFF